MEERTYNLSYLLTEQAYVQTVRAVLESRARKGLFKKDREAAALLRAFNEGKTSRDQASTFWRTSY